MATWGTVKPLSRGSGEDLGNCYYPIKITEALSTVHRCSSSTSDIEEIKMKNCALLSRNLPSVIDRSHLSPCREAARTGDKY